MRGAISRSMLALVVLGTHGTGVSGFASPLAHPQLSPGSYARAPRTLGAAMPRLQARRSRALRHTPCKWLHVSAMSPPCCHMRGPVRSGVRSCIPMHMRCSCNPQLMRRHPGGRHAA
jgi:hypothetical protein